MPRIILTLGLLFGAFSVSVLLAGCGGDDEGQFSNQPAGEFPIEVLDSSFKRVQTVAETYDLNITVRNSGDETIPALNTVIDLPGMGSTLAFAYGDKQPGLAMNQRPIWVVEEGWPKLAGTTGRGGATTPDRRTFEFGELEADETAEMIWRVVALRPGRYEVRYQVGAGLSPDTTPVDAAGEPPSGLLPVRISDFARLTEVNEKGQVVPVTRVEQARVQSQQDSAEPGLTP